MNSVGIDVSKVKSMNGILFEIASRWANRQFSGTSNSKSSIFFCFILDKSTGDSSILCSTIFPWIAN